MFLNWTGFSFYDFNRIYRWNLSKTNDEVLKEKNKVYPIPKFIIWENRVFRKPKKQFFGTEASELSTGTEIVNWIVLLFI